MRSSIIDSKQSPQYPYLAEFINDTGQNSIVLFIKPRTGVKLYGNAPAPIGDYSDNLGEDSFIPITCAVILSND